MTGTKLLAEKIRKEVKEFLESKLGLILHDEKTKITNISKEKIQYLGFQVFGRNRKYTESQISMVSTKGIKRRGGNSQIIIEAPIKGIIDKLVTKGFVWETGESKAKTN